MLRIPARYLTRSSRSRVELHEVASRGFVCVDLFVQVILMRVLLGAEALVFVLQLLSDVFLATLVFSLEHLGGACLGDALFVPLVVAAFVLVSQALQNNQGVLVTVRCDSNIFRCERFFHSLVI